MTDFRFEPFLYNVTDNNYCVLKRTIIFHTKGSTIVTVQGLVYVKKLFYVIQEDIGHSATKTSHLKCDRYRVKNPNGENWLEQNLAGSDMTEKQATSPRKSHLHERVVNANF